MLRLLANENIPGQAVASLRAAGHDVAWVREGRPGIADDAVLEWSMAEQRVLLTFDKDFGELVFRRGLAASCGVVLLRLAPSGPAHAAALITAAVSARDDWAGCFSVVDDDRIRMVRLR